MKSYNYLLEVTSKNMAGRGENNTTKQVQASTEILSYKWYAVVIEVVYSLNGARYSEIDSQVDQISAKMLSDALSDLRDRKILKKIETADENSRATYELTPKGKHLAEILSVLLRWNSIYNENNPSVLVVEDDPMALSVLSDYSSDPFDVRSVSCGEDAIKEYSEDTGLVILDRKLEEIAGDTVARQIKEQDSQALILVVSGVDPEDDILDLPVDDYLKKPVNRTKLRNRISGVLDRSDLGVTDRTYLELRSKQLALIESHGASALNFQAYENIEKRINQMDLPEEKIQLLEENLPNS